MKVEYDKGASYQRFGELPDHTKFIASDLVGGNQTYIKLGDFLWIVIKSTPSTLTMRSFTIFLTILWLLSPKQ